MIHFLVRPLEDSDWSSVHEVEIGYGRTIMCKASLGADLPPVKSGKPYFYSGTFRGDDVAQEKPIFSVVEIAETENGP